MSVARVGQGEPSQVIKAAVENQMIAAIPFMPEGWEKPMDRPVADLLNDNLRAVLAQVDPGFGTASVAPSRQQIRLTRRGRDKPY